MKTKQAVVITLLLSLVLMANFLFAQAPNLLNYQGKLTGTTTPTVPMTFAIYDAATGGTPIGGWTETWPSVPVTNGVFNVIIGKNSTPPGIPSSVFTGSGERYLEITVSGTSIGRFQLTSAAFAIRANQADGVADNAITSAKILNGTITGADIAPSTIGLNNVNFVPGSPIKTGVANSIVTITGSGATFTAQPVLTITPQQSGTVLIYTQARYNVRMQSRSQIFMGIHVNTTNTPPTSASGFTDARTVGWASAINSVGTSGDFSPVTIITPLSVTASTTYYIWFGASGGNYDANAGTFSSVRITATLHTNSGL